GDDSPDADLDAYLAAQLKTEARDLDAGGGPLVLMVHGFLFNPKEPVRPLPKPTNNPHAWIFHFNAGFTVEESWGHSTGWAARLGFADTETDHGFAGLPIAFGWFSAPGFNVNVTQLNKNFYSDACALADVSALPFLHLLERIAARLTNPIDIVAHSMGTQLTITALLKASDALLGRIGRVVLLGGSAYSAAGAALAQRLDALAAGVEVFNIVNRTDRVLGDLARHFGPLPGEHDVVGYDGVGKRFDSWVSLRLDDKGLQRWAGLQVDPTAYALLSRMPDGKIANLILNHWAYYAHDGNMKLFAHLFRHRKLLSIATLRAKQIPEFI
ncbi:MAG TPA: hypothetical protein VFR86_07830, partial [Burkholderiaceae bacterium]|nr:hypothetical protein [Burkholderiaceae bacterium]